MKTQSMCAMLLATGIMVTGCHESGDAHSGHGHDDSDGHTHADGTTHADHGAADHADEHDHEHAEVDLGTAMAGELELTLAQGHGAVEPGKEGHLVVKLPYNDNGESTVRAWIGTSDPTLSFVGKGDYAPSHDDYDIHAMAPNPMPEGAMWWVEVTKPNGETFLGSIAPITE